jgi:tRNA threonylcarbamoyladenosine biosynthesis protein TsaE
MMSGVSVVTRSAEETRGVGRALGSVLATGDLVLLAGDLGAGKTQLAKGIADALGVAEPVVSPTFTLAREYAGRVRMLHVDVYRLDRAQELIDLGLEEESDDAVTVIEWGDVAAVHLPHERLEVRLERLASDDGEGSGAGADADDHRLVTITPRGPAWSARAVDLDRVLHGIV